MSQIAQPPPDFACAQSGLQHLYVVIVENAQRRAFHVIILPARQRPHERREPGETQQQRHRHEIDQHVHATSLGRARTRSALSVTRMEEPDMAAAAMNGVTKPAIATGTAIAL